MTVMDRLVGWLEFSGAFTQTWRSHALEVISYTCKAMMNHCSIE